MELKLLF